MYGILPLEEYVANYDSILENKPFKFGNMKNRVLDKSKFFHDYSDYEILLRNEIPEKYSKYFCDAKNLEFDDEADIEIGRSNKLNLSPVKNILENGIKDSEVLFKKDKKFKIVNGKDNEDDAEFSLDLGNLLSRNKQAQPKPQSKKESKYSSENNTKEIIDIDNIDNFYEKTFKILSKNSLVDNDGKQLNYMIKSLIENLKDLKIDNNLLKTNSNDMKTIINDLNKLIDSYKSKLRLYYNENKNLKNIVKNQKFYDDDNNNDNIDSSDQIDEDIDSLDKKINLLQLKRQRLIEKRKHNNSYQKNLNIDELSDNIVDKLMKQLQDHNQHNNNSHSDCPFCENTKQSDIILTSLLTSNLKISNQENIIELLAERIKCKLDKNNDNKSIPDIW